MTTITMARTAKLPTGTIPIIIHRIKKEEKKNNSTKDKQVWQKVSPNGLILEMPTPSDYAEYSD